MKYTRRIIVLLLVLLSAALSLAQKSALPSGEQILGRIEANFAGIQDYTVTLDVAIDLDRLKVPDMKATMYFKQPDKTHFASDGFALLPKEGLRFSFGNLGSRFEVDSITDEKPLLKLVLRPKSDKTRLRKVYVAVNPVDWTVVQVTTPQMDGRQMTASFEYLSLENHRLPSALTVSFSSDTTETEPSELPNQRPPQIPRKGTMTVHYSDYHLNRGLSDEIFEQKKSE